MVRRSFRVGLRLGLILGLIFAVMKTVQARRSSREPALPEPWTPLADTGPSPARPPTAVSPPGAEGSPTARPVDEVGEPILEPPSSAAAVAPADPAAVAPAEPLVAGPGDVAAGPPAPPAAARTAAVDMSAVEPLPVQPLPVEPMAVEPVVPPARSPRKAPSAAAPVRKATGRPRGWVAPEEGVCPPTHPIKAKLASMIYHLPGMAAYNRTRPDRCYANERGALKDGFVKAKR